MATVAKKVSEMNSAAINSRLQKMLIFRAKFAENLKDWHIKLQKGNTKTGISCWTVSLIPIVDCTNCTGCKGKCYDIRNDCRYPNVLQDRAKNSAIHRYDRKRYWKEIEEQVRANFVQELRLNVGGDLDDEDFEYVAKMARRNKGTDVLFFTKNYKGINSFLEHHRFPKNVHAIMSAWPGMEMDNSHNLPTSHILWADGTTTAPDFGAKYCGGNCTECHFNGTGCWTLKKGESVIFNAH